MDSILGHFHDGLTDYKLHHKCTDVIQHKRRTIWTLTFACGQTSDITAPTTDAASVCRGHDQITASLCSNGFAVSATPPQQLPGGGFTAFSTVALIVCHKATFHVYWRWWWRDRQMSLIPLTLKKPPQPVLWETRAWLYQPPFKVALSQWWPRWGHAGSVLSCLSDVCLINGSNRWESVWWACRSPLTGQGVSGAHTPSPGWPGHRWPALSFIHRHLLATMAAFMRGPLKVGRCCPAILNYLIYSLIWCTNVFPVSHHFILRCA